MSLADLPAEARVGLMMNIPSLEAQEDTRFAMLIGAVMGGQEGQDYLKALQDLAWWDEPQEVRDAMKTALDDSLRTQQAGTVDANRPMMPGMAFGSLPDGS